MSEDEEYYQEYKEIQDHLGYCDIDLQGILGQVFDGKYCIRGYADIDDIIELSKTLEYQRNLDTEHVQEIREFYQEDKQNLFYPEIILGYSLEPKDMLNLQREISFQNEFFKATIPKSGITKLNFKVKKCLSIIDGNHRLNAYERNTTTVDTNIPFCIIFFPSNSFAQQQAIFTNINFKNKPLKLEEHLKNIFDLGVKNGDGTLYDNVKTAYLEKHFGKEYLEAIYLLDGLEADNQLSHFKQLFPDYREAALKLCECLLKTENYSSIPTDKVIVVLQDNLNRNIDLGLFIAMVYFATLEESKYRLFKIWVQKYDLDKLSHICTQDIINIYKNINQVQSRQIFVSMPFGKPDCDDMFTTVQDVLEKISRENNVVFPKAIRIDELEKSYSYIITDEILSHIENSGFIIADLTHQKQNVYHEIGYAMGYIKGKGLKENLLLVMREPETGRENDDKYNVGFNLRGYSQLRFKNITQFKREIETRIKVHFEIKNNA